MIHKGFAPTQGNGPDGRDFVDRLRWQVDHQGDQIAFTYLADGENAEESLTYAQLDLRRAIAEELLDRGMGGERALLLFPPGLDFVASLFGCFYAGVVAVPAFPPRRNRNMDRIQAIASDADACLALSVSDYVQRTGRLSKGAPELERMNWIATNEIPDDLADKWRKPDISDATLAVLQYTSGSTGAPKGVMLSHGTIVNNCTFINASFNARQRDIGMSWLPTYHDMGLVGGVLNPMCIGCTSILMSPTAFLQKPVRWLQGISKYRVSISGGPNFAYDVCTKKVTSDEMESLDLSSWTLAFNGAEPVRPTTIQNFARKFAAVGFKPEAFYPCYGMAESTLMITGGTREQRPLMCSFEGTQLDDGLVMPVETIDPHARQLVACGASPADGQLAIVDPKTSFACPPDVIGEVWVSSGSVGQGYYGKPEASERTFGAHLRTSTGVSPRRFLRTGDLGFFHQGQLFITGRLKDLIIVRGVNRYPQDIEQTVEHSDTRLRTGAAAAFAIDMHGRDQLIVVCEVERVAENNWDEVIGAVRRTVTATHQLPPDGVILIRAGSIPKTSSGKIQRHVCRAGFLDGSLMVIAKWLAWEQDDVIGSQSAAGRHGNNGHTSTAGNSAATISFPFALEAVYQAVRDIAGNRATLLAIDTNIVELGLDSLERLEIVNRLEDRFGGTFPESRLLEMETCRHVAEGVIACLGNSGADDQQPHKTRPVQPEDYHIRLFPEVIKLKQSRQAIGNTGMQNPYFRVHDGVNGATTIIDDRTYINWSSYNYLGMSGHPEVVRAATEAMQRYGTSCSASRLVSGEKPIHQELEREIAHFLGVESALTFVGGHATNETTIGRLMGPGDLILHDGLAHNSIMQGATLSGARRRQFPHNDWQALDDILKSIRHEYRRVLVVVEGVYSMDGDFPCLPRFIEIKKRHRALLMVDEAHSLGTMGLTGRGIGEHFAINPHDVDVWMGTLSKALGSCGGYIAGSEELTELLRYTADGFVYSVGLPPANAAASLAALRILQAQPQRAMRCRTNAGQLLGLAQRAGLNTGSSGGTPVVPVILGDSLLALQLSHALGTRGINVQPIMHPAVEERAARLRFFVTSEHQPHQIEATARALRESLRELSGGSARRIDPRARSHHRKIVGLEATAGGHTPPVERGH